MSGSLNLSEYTDDVGGFEDEQEVDTRSWYLATKTVTALRNYVIGQYGTTQHIGTVCTQAMRNWMADNPDDPAHRTWSRLQSDYDWGSADENVSAWNYRQYVDYADLPKEDKTALGFSAPRDTIEAFTEGLNKDEYGAVLANAIESELRKHAQIQRMHDLIDAGDADRSNSEGEARVEKVEVDEDGDPVDLSTVTMADTGVLLSPPDIISYAENTDVGWKTRRGLLTALIRNFGSITKDGLYTNDENLFGVEKTRRKRKDKDAILDYAKESDGPLAIAPAKIVADEMDHHNLPQAAGLTHREQPLEFDEYELEDLEALLYNQNEVSKDEMWARMVATVTRTGHALADVDWGHSDDTTAIYRGKHLSNSINRYLPLVTATATALEDADVESENNVAKLNRLQLILEDTRDNISSPGGKDIDEAHERAVEDGETPKSIEFKRGSNTPSTLEF